MMAVGEFHHQGFTYEGSEAHATIPRSRDSDKRISTVLCRATAAPSTVSKASIATEDPTLAVLRYGMIRTCTKIFERPEVGLVDINPFHHGK